MSVTYRTVMSFNYKYTKDDGEIAIEEKFVPFDIVTGRNINESSNIVTQPLLNGTNASDHSYRNPTTISLNGKFSMYGLYGEDESYNFISKNDATKTRLENIETTFKYLKDNGVLCTVYFMGIDDEPMSLDMVKDENMFSVRENFAIESFSFDETLGGMSFNINFKEIIIVDDTSYQEYVPGEPSLESFKVSSYTEYLSELPDDSLRELILRALYDNGYLENSWLTSYLKGRWKAQSWATLIAGLFVIVNGKAILQTATSIYTARLMASIAAAATSGGAVTGAVTGATIMSGIYIGLAAIAAVIIVSAIIYGVFYANKSMSKKKKSKAYIKLLNGSTEEGEQRLVSLLIDVRNALKQALTDLKVITFPKGATTSRGLVKLEGVYYEISTSINGGEDKNKLEKLKNNLLNAVGLNYNNYFKWEVHRASGDKNTRSNFIQNETPPINTDFNTMTRLNAWFRDEVNNKSFVWVYSHVPSLIESLQKDMDYKYELAYNHRKELKDYRLSFGMTREYEGIDIADMDTLTMFEEEDEKTLKLVGDYKKAVLTFEETINQRLYQDLSNYMLVICSEEIKKEYEKCYDVINEALGL